jgi:GNAT superfamily N-acetyltransferase
MVIAEARYARGSDPTVAEFAVSVSDQWQGQGLASRLLATLLCRAATAGIERIVGETLATNGKMLHLARKAGFAVTRSPDVRGVMLLEKVVRTEQAGRPCHASAAAA